MARPERPLDPDAGPLQKFAWDLRQLRSKAGNPGYREMATKAFRSSTALSEAASGRFFPSREVVLAYVKVCGGDEKEWIRRWDNLADQIGSANPSLSVAKAGAVGEPGREGAESDGAAPVSASRFRRRRWPAVVAGGSLVAVAVAAVGVWFGLLSRGDADGSTPAATDADPYREVRAAAALPTFANSEHTASAARADGGDPRMSGCADGAVTLDHVPVIFSGNRYIGELELRYSAQCGTAWGRISPSRGMDALIGPVISITATRPADGAHRAYQVRYDGQAAFGDMLSVQSTCASTSVWVSEKPETSAAAGDPTEGSARASTKCLR